VTTNKGAKFSECCNYRYQLWRIWDESLPLAMCIGLNPSTANADDDDATIIHLTHMLKRLGYGGFYMTNLFAIISSDPKVLLTCDDPIRENDFYLMETKQWCKDVIACWGAFKQAKDRIKVVLPKFPEALCFGRTKAGAPVHPLAMMYAGTTKTCQLQKFQQ
jgi:hypothetical protein